ncbi:MAG: hypothetical protein M0R68_10600 [Bacteroidetes bacterium]|nr:hypothetical protein [Bacteroidota bacterium]
MENEERPMDEFEWEEFLKKSDATAAKYSALLEKYMNDPNCDEIIDREMGWNSGKEDDETERPWIEEMNEAIEEMLEEEKSEEWKKKTGLNDGPGSGIEELDRDPLYIMGFTFAVDSIRWCESLPDEVKIDPDMAVAMQNFLIPAAKIAGASASEEEENDKDMLGLRLANYKRGISAANKSLNALSAVSAKGLIEQRHVFPFIKRATELRNALAVRIVELRDRFNEL